MESDTNVLCRSSHGFRCCPWTPKRSLCHHTLSSAMEICPRLSEVTKKRWPAVSMSGHDCLSRRLFPMVVLGCQQMVLSFVRERPRRSVTIRRLRYQATKRWRYMKAPEDYSLKIFCRFQPTKNFRF